MFSRLGPGYLCTGRRWSSGAGCLSTGQLGQSVAVPSSTESSTGPRSSLLGTVSSALGMQSAKVTPITCVTAPGEDRDV